MVKKQTDNPLTGGESGRCLAVSDRFQLINANGTAKELFLADRFYPSTQRCSRCGFVKTGDDKISLDGNMKHKTKHNEYVCYECGAVMDRDENAVMNLLALI